MAPRRVDCGEPRRREEPIWATRCPLGPGVTPKVRRVPETEEFPQDNEYVQKEIQRRAAAKT
ncbi:hypothetical protein BMW24_001590 [Mycobacterium heckeshornense]|nr:hypothetical protein BMW24_001590 [Mycobacterium heckeshornense]